MNQELHIQGAVTCHSCDSVFPIDSVADNCANCGAALKQVERLIPGGSRKFLGVMGFLKPLADSMEGTWKEMDLMRDVDGPSLKELVEGEVTCGWCSNKFPMRPESPNCTRCGGVLPMPPGNDPGPRPTAPPRDLPRPFVRDLFIKQNVGGIVGLVMLALSLPFLLAPPVGLGLMFFGAIIAYSNFATAHRRRTALAKGEATLGKIERIDRFGEEGGGHGSLMYRVLFRFDVGEHAYQGMKYTYDSAITKHFVGQPVWVVYLPKRPEYYAIWPPLA